MNPEYLICLIPLSIAYFSFTIWLYEKMEKMERDITLLIVTVFCILSAIGLAVFIYI